MFIDTSVNINVPHEWSHSDRRSPKCEIRR